jgi:glycosyltransferase involved in cell wall biosynthesis
LVIVGGSSQTDDYVKELQNLAKGNKNIIFTGEKSGNDLNVLFKNAYLFAQPSESEGLSIALLESMAYGVPALVSDIAENREPIGDCGLEFKNKSVRDLTQQLSFAFKHPRFMKQKAVEAKTRAAKCYDWENITKETVMVYDEAIAEGDTARKAKKIFKTSQVSA